jgi:hypothetical protein
MQQELEKTFLIGLLRGFLERFKPFMSPSDLIELKNYDERMRNIFYGDITKSSIKFDKD